MFAFSLISTKLCTNVFVPLSVCLIVPNVVSLLLNFSEVCRMAVPGISHKVYKHPMEMEYQMYDDT